MTGTLINVATILIGGMLGLIFGTRVPERLKATVISGMGLFTGAIGMQMFLKTENSLIVLGALLIGALLGEWWRIEDRLQSLGQILEARFAKNDPSNSNGEVGSKNFVRGFFNSVIIVLRWSHSNPWLDPGRPDWQLQFAGGQICARRIRIAGICIHPGCGCDVLLPDDFDLSRRHQSARRSIECNRDAVHDERDDRNRRCDFNRFGAQQFIRDQENPRRKFSSRAGHRSANRVDPFVVWALNKKSGRLIISRPIENSNYYFAPVAASA